MISVKKFKIKLTITLLLKIIMKVLIKNSYHIYKTVSIQLKI